MSVYFASKIAQHNMLKASNTGRKNHQSADLHYHSSMTNFMSDKWINVWTKITRATGQTYHWPLAMCCAFWSNSYGKQLLSNIWLLICTLLYSHLGNPATLQLRSCWCSPKGDLMVRYHTINVQSIRIYIFVLVGNITRVITSMTSQCTTWPYWL